MLKSLHFHHRHYDYDDEDVDVNDDVHNDDVAVLSVLIDKVDVSVVMDVEMIIG